MKIATIAGITCIAVAAGSANAQLVTHKDLSVTTAVTIAQTAVQTCKAQGYNVSAHVLGRSGEVLVAMRGDDTGPPRRAPRRHRVRLRVPRLGRRRLHHRSGHRGQRRPQHVTAAGPRPLDACSQDDGS